MVMLQTTLSAELYNYCERGHLSEVKKILDRDDFDADWIDWTMNDDMRTPLIVASREGHVDIVKLLLNRGANIFQTTSLGDTALHEAILHDRDGVVRSIVEICGLDILRYRAKNFTINVLETAIDQKNVEMTRLLLELGADSNGHVDYGIPILHSAVQKDSIEIVEILLEHGADINSVDCDGDTALIVLLDQDICSYHRKDIVELLLKHGAEVNACNFDGESPLFVAVQHEYEQPNVPSHEQYVDDTEIVKLLISHGASVNTCTQRGQTPWMIALHLGNVDMFRAMEKDIDPNALYSDPNNIYLDTLLHYNTSARKKEMVRLLLEQGADPCVYNFENSKRSVTPLHLAVQSDHLDICETLVKYGGTKVLFQKSCSGEIPLHWAARSGSMDIVELFVQAGGIEILAEVSEEGETSYTIAAAEKNHDLLYWILLSRGQESRV